MVNWCIRLIPTTFRSGRDIFYQDIFFYVQKYLDINKFIETFVWIIVKLFFLNGVSSVEVPLKFWRFDCCKSRTPGFHLFPTAIYIIVRVCCFYVFRESISPRGHVCRIDFTCACGRIMIDKCRGNRCDTRLVKSIRHVPGEIDTTRAWWNRLTKDTTHLSVKHWFHLRVRTLWITVTAKTPKRQNPYEDLDTIRMRKLNKNAILIGIKNAILIGCHH